MSRPVVGVNVTAHRKEQNMTDIKKRKKLWVCYYVELVVGSPRENHTRLGFSGSFQALVRLHREFLRLYIEKYGESQGGLLTGRESFLSSSSSTSRSSVSSTSKRSPTSFSSIVRHTFRLKKESTTSNEVEEEEKETTSKLHTHQTHHAHDLHHQYMSAIEPPGIVSFPVQKKLLLHLESGEAKDDEKIEARNAALFEYYSQLFNSFDSELYLELVYQRAQERATKNKSLVCENQSEDEAEQISSSKISGGFFNLLRHRNTEGVKSSKQVEFVEPVYVRTRGKSRRRRSTHRNSSLHAP
ncbi:unnamed protein product [Peronospora farinosa]|uniref:PX domain-containing protein n=1 Tax=Peronospora farinosa TaxID=134698 RepID=A0ABN8C9A0_9STRA|nr:unnamed protein product [Peronospora farinosa]